MSKSVKFKFEKNLPHQDKAIDSVVSLFSDVDKSIDNIIYSECVDYFRRKNQPDIKERRNIKIINGKKLRENLREIQSKNGLILNDEVETDNNTLTFTIEMETGTGKTYVYLKTILELYEKYSGRFKKFIIVVPTVPIRMGVEKSVKMLKEHFKKETKKGIDISKHIIIYDSKLKDVAESVRRKFIDSKDLSILVMNTQAFNKDTNILRNTDHEKNTENISVWDEIRQLHPVVIIDEPQKFDGGKNSKKR
ncbi:MAG: DEAD/DEAH box helicase family protein, partial [Clostridium perfringens]|nr:DEAD/DEAH box helicase family protein [Clostridium perfringens]